MFYAKNTTIVGKKSICQHAQGDTYIPALKSITLSIRSLRITSSTAALDGVQMSKRGLAGLRLAPNCCPGRHLVTQDELARRVSSYEALILLQ